jgi:transposase
MVVIGIDPHKGSHTAVVVDEHEQQLARVKVAANRTQLAQLLAFAQNYPQRRWAVESADGLGLLVSRQLLEAGEDVVDVPATLAARVRVLGSGKASKNDGNDAHAVAVAALRRNTVQPVVVQDATTVLRLLADRHKDLTGLRTQAVCRLHALLRDLIPGGVSVRMTATAAAQHLARLPAPTNAVEAERQRLARDLLADIDRHDTAIRDIKDRIRAAVAEHASSVSTIHGVGPVVAALILGHTRDVRRFPTRHHYASYNGTAPIEASSGELVRHRLNPRGNRQLNHALHIIAVVQLRHDTPGRAYYDRKIAEGKSRKEAMRALRRRISDNVYAHLRADLEAQPELTAHRDE